MAASSGDCLGAAGVDISPRRDDGRRSSPIGEQYQRVLDEHVERIAAQHGGLEVSGKAVEGPFPSRVLIDSAKENGMLVMGTHSRKALGRAVFGSVTHSVLLNLVVPTVIVPRV